MATLKSIQKRLGDARRSAGPRGIARKLEKRSGKKAGKGRITHVNPNEKSWTKHRYILGFGAYGDTLLMVWANGIEDALDEAIDWIADHKPGLLADEQVKEAYEEAIAEGKDEMEAQEEAETDTTSGGNNGHYILSHEWTIVAEDPTREQVLEIEGR